MIDLSTLRATVTKPLSYKRGVRESSKVKVFDPSKHKIVHETSSHYQYDCPYCLSVRGKEDNDGKFYFSKEKKIGFCFKCNSVGVLETNKDISELDLELSLSRLKNQALSNREEEYSYSKIDYEKMFDELDEEGMKYLEERCPIYPDVSDKLRFRVMAGKGIAVPIRFWGRDISYNLRFYHPSSKMKYFIPHGVKYLYSPNNVFCKDGCFQEITLVEGYFDAIGALLDGFKNPIAIFGKTITPLQISMLRSISPSKINVYLDESKLSWKLYWNLKRSFPTVRQIDIIPSKNYDPEERLICSIRRCKTEEDLTKFLSKLVKIVNENFYQL